jgi:uncharacterized FlaG/YvyC family protein
MTEEIDGITGVSATLGADLLSPGASRTPTAQSLQAAVSAANARLSSVNRVLELRVDPASGLTIATIIDGETGTVIQQFPGTDSLHLAQMLADWAQGKNVLLDLIA